MGIGCTPNTVSVAWHEVVNKDSIKFLGLTTSSDLKWNLHVGKLCNQIRYAANRIRNEGRYFSIQDRTRLFNGWARSLIHNNGLTFLPFLTKNLILDLRRAINSCVRAIHGPRRYGAEMITSLRKLLKIPSLEEIKDYVCLIGAWERRDMFKSKLTVEPRTRRQHNRCLPAAGL